MAISQNAKAYHDKMLGPMLSSLQESDPDFVERFDNFAFDEVPNTISLDEKSRWLSILAVLVGCQGLDEYRVMVGASLNFNVTAIEIKEIVYQAVDYLGIGRVLPFLKVTNEVFKEKSISLPLFNQATTTVENCLERGIQAQVDIFGEKMRDFYKSGPQESRPIRYWLAKNCFGQTYTRNALDYKQREMITFCFLAAQGGCEPQLTSHASANLRIGNDPFFLIQVISECLPYMGYPRVLNALRCIEDAVCQLEEKQ